MSVSTGEHLPGTLAPLNGFTEQIDAAFGTCDKCYRRSVSDKAATGANETPSTDSTGFNSVSVIGFVLQKASGSPVALVGSCVAGTTHTAEAGSSRVLVLVGTAVGFSDSGSAITSATYGGQTLTFVEARESDGSGYDVMTEVWILDEAGIAAASGSTFSVNWSGTPYAERYMSCFYTNVDQTTSIGAKAENFANAATPNPITTTALANSSGDMVLAVASGHLLGSYVAQNGFTEQLDVQYNGGCGDCFTHTVADKAATGANETPSMQHTGLDSQSIIGIVLQKAPSFDSDGDLTASATITEPIAISSIADTVGERVAVFDFSIADGGTADALPLAVSQVVLNTSGTGTFADITWQLDGPDASFVTGTVGGGTITFSSLSISVADGLSETYTVYAYFSTSPTSTDGQTFILSVDGDTDLTVGGSGTQMGTTSAVNNSTGSTMDVVRSQLIFSTQPPASATTNTDFSGTIAVSATDVNNNVDIDFGENITLSAVITGTHTAPGGTLTSTDTGGTTKSPTSGVATWTDTKYNVAETIDIKAVSATTYTTGIFSTSVTVAQTPDSDGDLTASATITEPIALSSIADTVGERVAVFDFSIADGGTADAFALAVSQVVLNTSGTGTFADITWQLDGPDASFVTGTVGAGTITFSSLSISVADGLSETYTVYAYFSTSPTSTDGQTFILSVDGDTDLTVGGSGTQMGTTSAVNNSTGSTMDVVHTQLIFSTQPPSSATPNTDFSGTIAVSATDVNNNVDTAFSENITISAVITITHTAPGGTLTSTDAGGTTKSPTNGVATWTDTKYNVAETIDIKAVSATTYTTGIFSTAVNVSAVACGTPPQVFTVNGTYTHPEGCDTATIKAWGAGGGSGGSGSGATNGYSGDGGGGGFSQATISINAAETLDVVVGTGGGLGTGGGQGDGGGGGGYSEVKKSAVIQVTGGSGGGGSGGDNSGGCTTCPGGDGGVGGGTTGGAGGNADTSIGGGGGTPSSEGTAGTGGSDGTSGATHSGGDGGDGGSASTGGAANGGTPSGGAGGALTSGGWTGGGGGGSGVSGQGAGTGGGGGSSYTIPSGTSPSNISGSGVNAGNNSDTHYQGNAGRGATGVIPSAGNGAPGNNGLVVIVPSATSDSDGDLTASATITEPIAISSIADTVGERVAVFDFNIADGGTADALALAVSQVVLNTSGTGTFADITWQLDGPDASFVTGTVGGGTITFSGLSISVADAASETYTVYAYFSTSPTSTDGQTFILSVDGDTDLTVGGSGTQMGTTSAVNNSTGSTMDVAHSQLIFSTQPPASAMTGTDFSGTIAVTATDVNNNVDIDFSETMTISAVITSTHTAPGGTLTSTDAGGTTKSPTNGVATWTDTKYDVAETIDIKAVSATTYTAGIFSTAVAVAQTPDVDGDLTASATITEPIAISSIADTVGERVAVFDFSIADGGTADALALAVSQVVLNTSGTGTFADITWQLNGPDASFVAGTVGGGTITFSSLSISVADGGSETYTVYAYFSTSPTSTDGQTFILSVDGDTDLTVGGGGTQMGTTSAVNNSTGSTMDVAHSKLIFSTQPPASATLNTDFSGTIAVSATDVNNNVDIDFGETITISAVITATHTAPGGTLSSTDTGGTTKSPTSGVATWTDSKYDFAETIDIKAVSATYPAGIFSTSVTVAAISAAVTGTITPSATEAEIVSGGKTIILTLGGDTWVSGAGGGFPQVQSVTETSFAPAATSHLVLMPATVDPGDLLIMLVSFRDFPASATPGGWTPLFAATSGLAEFTAYAKDAVGTEDGTTVDVTTGSNATGAAQVYRITNWEGTLANGVEVGTSAIASSSGPNSPSLTASWGVENNLWLAVASGSDDDVACSAQPSNYTICIDTMSLGGGNLSAQVYSASRENPVDAENPAAFLLASSEDWVANTIVIRPAQSTFDSERQNIINGLDSAQAETDGWDLVVAGGIPVGNVARTSDTVVTITLPALPSYNITATETITATVPATALVLSGSNLTASPTFDVTADLPDLQQVHYRWRNDDGAESGVTCDETKVFLGTADTTYQVPDGCDQLTVKAWGAGGAGGGADAGDGGAGGGGGYATSVLSVTALETLNIVIGGGGAGGVRSGSGSGGSGGGGTPVAGGGAALTPSAQMGGGGGGGGYAAVKTGATFLVIGAGGGGGAGGGNAASEDSTAGGAGGGTNGVAAPNNGSGVGGGQGGTQAAGGLAGTCSGCTNGSTIPTAGSLNQGGDGGTNGGGGGGGGYYGGGGGRGDDDGGAGGGGGSGLGDTLTAGAGTVPGNSGDADRGTAGDGGAGALATDNSGGNGNPGRIVIVPGCNGGCSSAAGATFAANEDIALTGLTKHTIKRLRLEVSNQGAATSGSVLYRLEVSEPNPPSSLCANATTWTRVDSSSEWNMADSTHFADADATQDVLDQLSNPGLTNVNTTFVAGESKDTTDEINTGITLSATQFTEIEYALKATNSATGGATYCFRLIDGEASPEGIGYTESTYGKVTLGADLLFGFRKSITFDHLKFTDASCGATLTNFPVLVSLTDAELKHVDEATPGKVADLEGDDIIFRSYDAAACGASAPCGLDHEIEKYDPTTGQLVAWVRIPVLNTKTASSDTVIYMYYGNSDVATSSQDAAGVWDADYVGVWHLNEDVVDEQTSGTHTDSTSNSNNTNQNGNVEGAGQIANGQVFDGTNDYLGAISLAMRNSTGANSIHSMEGWFKTSAASSGPLAMWGDSSTLDGSTDADGHIGWRSGTGNLATSYYASGAHHDVTDISSYRDGNWHHVAIRLDGSSLKLYVDGGYIGENTSVTSNNNQVGATQYWWLGVRSKSSASSDIDDVQYFSGTLDEIRLSDSSRDACWIEGQYKTSNEPGDIGDTTKFYDVGTEESALLTFADVTTFTAEMGSQGGVRLNWRTSDEISNLGFHLYREQNGQRVRVTPEMVAGSALFAGPGTRLTSGHSYGWWDRQGRASDSYWLEDVDLDGTRSWSGPVSPSAGSQEQGSQGEVQLLQSMMLSQLPRGEPLKTVLLTSGPQMPQAATALGLAELPQQWALAASSAVKLEVRERGWYRVEQPELMAAGLDSGVNPKYLQLFVQGQQQALVVRGESDESFDAWDAIEFYASGVDTSWTDTQVCWLVEGADLGQRAPALMPTWAATAEPDSFPYTLEQRERTIYVAALRNGEEENFYGPVVTATPVDQVIDVHHWDGTQDAQLEVTLQGLLDDAHQVKVLFNGVELGVASYFAWENDTTSFTVSAADLVEGDNTVTMVAEGGASDISLIDVIRLTYAHTYTVDSDSLEFTVEGQGVLGQPLTIDGFSNALIQVADVTDPMDTQLLDVVVQQEAVGYSITVGVPGAGTRTLLALTEDQIKSPATVVANGVSSWHDDAGAEVVMIAYGDFVSSLEPLKALRESQGYSVALVAVEDLYDEFAFGVKTPWALRDFLEKAKSDGQTSPRFVLLVGDASSDPRDYSAFGPSDFVPTWMVETAVLETASDDWFVDFDLDGVPDLAIGRLPVRTVSETNAAVAKILAYEAEPQGAWQQQALMVTDENDALIDFEGITSTLKAFLPNEWTVDDILRGQSGAATNAELLAKLNEGQQLVNYMGHGSTEIWGDLLSSGDIASLSNGSKLPFFVSLTCLNGFFHDIYTESLAESLIRSEQGGAMAVWASSGLNSSLGQLQMASELYRLLFDEGLALGEAAA